jgi:adenylylsulfate kinase-like enzyme
MTTTQGVPTPRVFWITGLSGAGKTSTCAALVAALRAEGLAVVMLDGDELREVMDVANLHTREQRLALAISYARLCALIARQGINVAIATISLFHEVHAWNRHNLPGYFEIYMRTPMSVLESRDPKRLYTRARKGEIANVAGVNFAVDAPVAPDLLIDHAPGEGPEAIAARIMLHAGINRIKTL